MELKGNNFTLRPWQEGDEESLAKHANNKKIADNLADRFPNPYTLKDAEEWIKLNLENEEKSNSNFTIIVDGNPVGGIGVEKKKDELSKTGVLGYWLGEEHWGKGIVSEAVRIIVEHAFNKMKLERIEARVFDYNKASSRVLEKNGFKQEGIMRKRALKHDKLYDEYFYAKLKGE